MKTMPPTTCIASIQRVWDNLKQIPTTNKNIGIEKVKEF